MSVGGSIEEVGIDNVPYSIAADADGNFKVGGWENEEQPNGNGTMRMIKKRVAAKLTGLTYDINMARDDLSNLQNIADNDTWVDCYVKFTSGAVWQNTCQIVGEVNYSNQSSTASFDLAGSTKWTRQQ